MGSGTTCVRYLFFAFNLLFWILGIVALGIGIYSRVETDKWKELVNSSTIFETANLLIAAGVIVATIGFFGCCGAYKKSQWMLVCYAILVVFIFAIEITAGAYAYAKREKVEEEVTSGLKKGVNTNYGKTDIASKGFTEAIDWFQEKVGCCGAAGPDDWKNSEWYSSSAKIEVVPKSCCRSPATNCSVGVVANSTSIYNNGCITEGKIFVKDNINLIGGIGVGVAVVQMFGIISALCLCKEFKEEDSE